MTRRWIPFDYPNRSLCEVLEEMRKCYKTYNFGNIIGLIEEAQSMGNRMESKLKDMKDMKELQQERKEAREELKKIYKELDKAKAKLEEVKDANKSNKVSE